MNRILLHNTSVEASNLISGISTTQPTRNGGSTLYESPLVVVLNTKQSRITHLLPDELISSNESELVYELNTTDDNVKTDILIKL